jgi:hypothetical protein
MTHKIRMNTELRNKLFNKIKHTFENESTQEKEAIYKLERMLMFNISQLLILLHK